MLEFRMVICNMNEEETETSSPCRHDLEEVDDGWCGEDDVRSSFHFHV